MPKSDHNREGVAASLAGQYAKQDVLRFVPIYLLYCIYLLVSAPFLLFRFVHRLRKGQYRNSLRTRVAGGTMPPEPGTLTIVCNGPGEMRSALIAARQVSRSGQIPVHVVGQKEQAVHDARRQAPDLCIGYAPAHEPFSSIRMLLKGRPKAIWFVETTANYHLAFWARVFKVPTLLININISESLLRSAVKTPFGVWKWRLPNLWSAQGDRVARRLELLGIKGDSLRVSGIAAPLAEPHGTDRDRVRRAWHQRFNLDDRQIVIVAGSTYEEEEGIILEAFVETLKRSPDAVLIVAPRDIHRAEEVTARVRARGMRACHVHHAADGRNDEEVVVLGTIGELAEAYCIAKVAFVGGSFDERKGGHTPLEPIAWEVPVTMGPEWGRQELIVDRCLRAGALVQVRTASEMQIAWTQLAQNGRASAVIVKQELEANSRNNFVELWRWFAERTIT